MTTILLRSLIALGCLAGAAVPAAAQQSAGEQELVSPFPEQAPPHSVLLHPHRAQRDKYLWGTFGPPGVLDSVISAGFTQWMNRPKEWGQAESGYVKRFASEYAESAINATTKYALARFRDEDPSFHRCGCTGVGRRTLHAIVSPFVAYRFDDGQPQFSIARLAGTATSNVVSTAGWKPATTTFASQAAHLGTDLLSAMGVSLLREFVFHHKQDVSPYTDGQ
jgi:hypothetical protein